MQFLIDIQIAFVDIHTTLYDIKGNLCRLTLTLTAFYVNKWNSIGMHFMLEYLCEEYNNEGRKKNNTVVFLLFWSF